MKYYAVEVCIKVLRPIIHSFDSQEHRDAWVAAGSGQYDFLEDQVKLTRTLRARITDKEFVCLKEHLEGVGYYSMPVHHSTMIGGGVYRKGRRRKRSRTTYGPRVRYLNTRYVFGDDLVANARRRLRRSAYAENPALIAPNAHAMQA